MKKTNTKVLEKLEKTFKENDWEEVRLVLSDSGESDVDILTTLHRGFGSVSNLAEGEFYFLEGEGSVPDIFAARIIVMAQVPTDNIPELLAHIAVINAELIAGSYEYDAIDDELAYSLKVPVVASSSETEVYDLADSVIATALSQAEPYASVLVEVANKPEVTPE